MENTAVTRWAWIVVVIWLQAWSFTNSSLISKEATHCSGLWHTAIALAQRILATSQPWHRLQQWPVMIKSWEWEHDFYFNQTPKYQLAICYWPRHLSSLGQAKTAPVIYPLLNTLYSCCATLINSVSMSQDWFQCSVLESKVTAVAVEGYKHGISMTGEVSLFFLLISSWFLLQCAQHLMCNAMVRKDNTFLNIIFSSEELQVMI